MNPRIGFVGIGLMGHGMAKNLLAKGYPLTLRVHRNRANVQDLLDAGAVEVATNAQVAQAADIVFICVTGAPEVEEVVLGDHGLREGARAGLLIVDCSTSEPETTRRLRDQLAGVGVTFVDAPLARTPKEAEEGRLNTMVGADASVFARIEPVLRAFSENVFHVGPPGAGHVVKLLNNFVALSIAAASAEAFAAATKAGVGADKLHQVISAGAVNNGIFQALYKAFAGDLAGLRFGLDNARKDLRYYTHLAETVSMPSPVGDAVHQAFATASALGYGTRFVPSLVEAQEELLGIEILPR